jgi:hypothetical protein
MKRTLVQYRVRPECAADNEAAIRAVFEQLRERRPPGVRYAAFVLEDGVTFVHLVLVDTPDGVNPLSALPAFQAFTAGVKERCDVAPTFRDLRGIGSHGVSEPTEGGAR